MPTDHPLPADIDAERATLGSILLNREAIVPIAPWLKPEHFYLEKHAWIYTAMLACYDRQQPPDIRLVAAELTSRGRLDAVGGYPYLADLSDAVPTSYHVEHYARIVERCAVGRAIIAAGARIAALGYNQHSDPDALLAAAYQVLDDAADRPASDDALVPISAVLDAQYDAIRDAIDRGEQVQLGVQTGLRDLDELTGGLHKQDLIVVAARPSVGKSALAACIAYHVGMARRRVDVFSLEMSREQYTQRLIAIDSGLNLHAVRLWNLSERDLSAYLTTMGRLSECPIAIDDGAALSVADIRARVLRRAAQLGRPELVIVDYLQLMQGRRDDGRVQEVSDISRGLKNLAKELDVPLIALSQLSRAVEGRTSHVPMLSDLRESGAIEQDADIVLFIYREELYDKESDKKGIAELHIAKHRNGPIGVIPARFDSSTTRFSDLTYRTPDNPGVGWRDAWPNND